MKILKIGDISKFSFSEMTSNNTGKTSATSTAGIYIIAIGGLGFLLGCIDALFLDKLSDIINQAIMFTSIGAALLGVKSVINKANEINTTSDLTPKEPEQLNS